MDSKNTTALLEWAKQAFDLAGDEVVEDIVDQCTAAGGATFHTDPEEPDGDYVLFDWEEMEDYVVTHEECLRNIDDLKAGGLPLGDLEARVRANPPKQPEYLQYLINVALGKGWFVYDSDTRTSFYPPGSDLNNEESRALISTYCRERYRERMGLQEWNVTLHATATIKVEAKTAEEALEEALCNYGVDDFEVTNHQVEGAC